MFFKYENHGYGDAVLFPEFLTTAAYFILSVMWSYTFGQDGRVKVSSNLNLLNSVSLIISILYLLYEFIFKKCQRICLQEFQQYDQQCVKIIGI